MHHVLRSLAIVILITIFSVSTARGTTLYSGVDHAEYLDPIPQQAQAFNQRPQSQNSQNSIAFGRPAPQPVFDPPLSETAHLDAYHSVPRLTGNANVTTLTGNVNAAAPSAPIIEWFMIPKFMAGAWRKQGDLTVSYRDLRTNSFTSMSAWTENEMSITWGHLYDRQGNVWHADILPLEKDGWSKGKLARFMMVALKCERTDPKQLVTRARYMVTESYVQTSQIVDVFQQESLNDYTLMADGEMENMSSNRVYSSQGRPLREGSLVSRLQKTAGFTPQRYQNNIDLVQSLNGYLQSHGMSDLIITNL